MDILKKSETKWLPDGFHFLGPTESKTRQDLVRKLTDYIQQEGYSEVILPSMDYSQSFLNSILPEEESSVLRFRDLNGQELSPGTDLTVQVVKGMAGLSHLTENQNVFYVSKRIRDHKKRNASRREILQIGAERLGSSSPDSISKILHEVDNLLRLTGLTTRPVIVLGNTILLRELLMRVSSREDNPQEELRSYIHTKNRGGVKSFCAEYHLTKEMGNILEDILDLWEPEEVPEFLEKSASSFLDKPSLKKLISSFQEIEKSWNREERFSDLCVDLSLVRDLNYYTGFLFQGYLGGSVEPIVTGGQYDHLYGIYSEEEKEACGYAIHVDAIPW